MPCVLRRLESEEISATSQTTNHYRLVGVTYILGIMDGEFLKGKNVREPQTFTLH